MLLAIYIISSSASKKLASPSKTMSWNPSASYETSLKADVANESPWSKFVFILETNFIFTVGSIFSLKKNSLQSLF
jgi:hypothetical protein